MGMNMQQYKAEEKSGSLWSQVTRVLFFKDLVDLTMARQQIRFR